MKLIAYFVLGTFGITFQLHAQNSLEIERLRWELRQATDNLDKAMQAHRKTIEAIYGRLQALEAAQQSASSVKPVQTPKITGILTASPQSPGPGFTETSSAASTNTTSAGSGISDHPASGLPAWSPSQPLTVLRSGPAYMNISFDALVDAGWSTRADVSQDLEQGHHDPLQRGFSLRNAEIALDGAVDPYFKGFANITFAVDKEQSTEVELEEAYLLTTALPGNLQAKAGQFFADFGRHNPTHPHTWAFVDQPLVLTRLLGPDGLRNPGAQLSWVPPTPFYLDTSVGIFNGQGDQAFSFRNRGEADELGRLQFAGHETLDRHLRGPGDFLVVPRVSSSFDITEQQTVLAGASAAFGPNDTANDSRTQIYGLDFYWKWKSPRAHAGFPFVSFQTEAIYRRLEAGSISGSVGSETLRDWGFYSQALWGFKPRWVVGLRGEYVDGNRGLFQALDRFRGERSRISPNLSWYPTEFSKLRLQYNFDRAERFGTEHSVWLQAEFLLGAHGAHKF